MILRWIYRNKNPYKGKLILKKAERALEIVVPNEIHKIDGVYCHPLGVISLFGIRRYVYCRIASQQKSQMHFCVKDKLRKDLDKNDKTFFIKRFNDSFSIISRFPISHVNCKAVYIGIIQRTEIAGYTYTQKRTVSEYYKNYFIKNK